MMRRWEANGISLGWNEVSDPNIEAPLPLEALEAVCANLAVRLAPKVGAAPDPAVVQMATDGLGLLRRDILIAHPIEYKRPGRHYDIYTDSYR